MEEGVFPTVVGKTRSAGKNLDVNAEFLGHKRGKEPFLVFELWRNMDGVSAQGAAGLLLLRDLAGHCCAAGRIESATHENATRPARHPVATRLHQKFLEPLYVLLWPLQPQRLLDRKIRVATNAQLSVGINQRMSCRQPVNVLVHSPRPVLTPLLQKKIAYELRVEFRRDVWCLAEDFESVAEIKPISRLRMKKRPGPDQISQPPECPGRFIPKCEGKVPVKVRKAILTPAPPGPKNSSSSVASAEIGSSLFSSCPRKSSRPSRRTSPSNHTRPS